MLCNTEMRKRIIYRTIYIIIDIFNSKSINNYNEYDSILKEFYDVILPYFKDNISKRTSYKLAIITFKEGYYNWVLTPTNIFDIKEGYAGTKKFHFSGISPVAKVINETIKMIEASHEEKPLILLFSKGMSIHDEINYSKELSRCSYKNNNFSRCFRNSIKISIGMNVNEYSESQLRQFGNLKNKYYDYEGYLFPTYYDIENKKWICLLMKIFTMDNRYGL